MTPTTHDTINCCQNEKIITLEKEITDLKAENAELNARLDNKKDDIHGINKELVRDRETQIKLLTEVTALKTLLEQSQKERTKANDEVKELKDKIDKLEIGFTDFKSSVNSFRNTVLTIFGVGTPIVSVIVVILTKIWGL